MFGRTVLSIPIENTFKVLSHELIDKNILFNHTKQSREIFTHFTSVNVNTKSKEYFFLEIFNNEYYLTSFNKDSVKISLKNKCAHLALNQESNKIFDQHIFDQEASEAFDKNICACLQIFDTDIQTECMGKSEIKNIELMLKTVGLYDRYSNIFLFLSRVKSILFDIETVNSFHTDESTASIIENKVFTNTSDRVGNKTLSHFNSLLIGATFYINMKSLFTIFSNVLKGNFLTLYKSRFFYSKLKCALEKLSLTEHSNLSNKIILEQYKPHYRIFEEMDDFFSHILFCARLSEILHYIMLYPLIINLQPYKDSKGIFSNLYSRITTWNTNSYIWAYNSSKFDSILVFKELTPILLNKYKSGIGVKTMKRGLSVISINYTVSNNLNCEYNYKLGNVTVFKAKYKKSNGQKLCTRLIFRDLKQLVPFGSLDENCQKYNIHVSKMLFPYSFLKSKQFLKSITLKNILRYKDLFYDVLAGKIMDENDIETFINQFTKSNCNNLFEYLHVYLMRDIELLYLLFNKTLDSFFEQDINFVLQQKLTISSIAFYHMFINENFANVNYNVLHKTTSKLLTYFLSESIIGGYTCSNTRGKIDTSHIINKEYVENLNVNPKIWPSLKPNLVFDKPVKKITTYDIISLYPSACSQGRNTQNDCLYLFQKLDFFYR